MANDNPIPARFEKALSAIDSALSEGKKGVTEPWSRPLRGHFFRLEGLSRLYSDYPKAKKRFDEIEEGAKDIEDRVGKLNDIADHLQVAKDLKAGKAVIDDIQKKLEKKTKKLADHLEGEGWFSKDEDANPLLLARHDLKKLKWLPYDEDRKFVLGEIARVSLKLHRRLEKGWYDLNELQTGVHEMRRNIRWISIYSSALNGMVLTDRSSCPVPDLEKILRSPWDESKYAQLSGPEMDRKPCYIPRCLYVSLSRIVELLGDIKDVGEWHEFLVEELGDQEDLSDEDAGLRAWELLKKHKIWKKLADEGLDPAKGTADMARRLQEEMLKTGLLSQLSESFQACAEK